MWKDRKRKGRKMDRLRKIERGKGERYKEKQEEKCIDEIRQA